MYWAAAVDIGGDNVYTFMQSRVKGTTLEQLLDLLAKPTLLVHVNERIDPKSGDRQTAKAINYSLIASHHLASAFVLNSEKPAYASVVVAVCESDEEGFAELSAAADKPMSFSEADALANSLPVTESGLRKYKDVLYANKYCSISHSIYERLSRALGKPIEEDVDLFLNLVPKPKEGVEPDDYDHTTLLWKVSSTRSMPFFPEWFALNEISMNWIRVTENISPKIVKQLMTTATPPVKLSELLELLSIPQPQDCKELLEMGIPPADIIG